MAEARGCNETGAARQPLVLPEKGSDPPPRPLIDRILPRVPGGEYPIKRTVGDQVRVEADIVADGHDVIRANVLFRHASEPHWTRVPLRLTVNDRYRAAFTTERSGSYLYTVEAWVDDFGSWQKIFQRKLDAAQATAQDLLAGAQCLRAQAERSEPAVRDEMLAWAARLAEPELSLEEAARRAQEAARVVAGHADRRALVRHEPALSVVVDRALAAFSSWYELFPRSCGPEGRHGTLRDCAERLPYVAEMGFDILYLPPIHPIGRAYRKGRNNALQAAPEDPGSPWAIGGWEGGHKSIHPELGTLEDFAWLRDQAQKHGLELALDIALQAAPEHPYVREHPEWFRKRPDGTIQYAENPPKKYQDIYPFWFECPDWRALWEELYSIFEFWLDRGVRVFRVDNPHTKPLRFWHWCLGRLRARDPGVIFLAEAFTRPKLMYALAKVGFSQSYTYFTWRNTADELAAYAEELSETEVVDFFRPNFWPNTPDILPEHLQFGSRGTFIARLVLAATMSANYGIYGPAFELMEKTARPGAEEYLDNEKYEIKSWDLQRADSLRHIIARVNRIRRKHPALQRQRGFARHQIQNPLLLCYSRTDDEMRDVILVVVNLDPHHRQSGWVHLDRRCLGLEGHEVYQVHELLSDARYIWQGDGGYVELDPARMPAHIFHVRRKVRTESDFDYFD